jgi:hypothetical protein
MSKHKGDKDMQAGSEEFVNRSVQLSSAHMKAYVEPRGHG